MESKTTVVDVPVELLHPNLVQNARRHSTQRAVQTILDDMDKHKVGVRRPLDVVANGGKTYAIADGHRRWSAAKAKGLRTVPCIIHPAGTDPNKLWAVLNGPTVKISAKDWFYAWAACSDDEREAFRMLSPKMISSCIKSCIRIFGMQRSIELGLTGRVTPTIANSADWVYGALRTALGELPFTRKHVAEWIVEHGTDVRNFIGGKPNKKALRKLLVRVKNGQAFPRGDW